MKNVKPRIQRRIRGLAGRKLVFESFGPRAPIYLAITSNREMPAPMWISPAELRRFVTAAQKALR